ncbi:MAG: phosphoribosylformylglycinamidine synthase [Fibrobacteria bacterium]|nr:phosphoribosylformylglycinamidine synthase [Fibrobacteria bacterium]
MTVYFYKNKTQYFLVEAIQAMSSHSVEILAWLLDAQLIEEKEIKGRFIGPRREMVTPWSTNAVEIAQNTGVAEANRIECFFETGPTPDFDPMLQQIYDGLNQESLKIDKQPEPIRYVEDIAAYNKKVGLALSPDEIEYLEKSQQEQGRPFTDSEIFGFAQINSEHCRHKIFTGKYILDGHEKEQTLFGMIKQTTKDNPGSVLTNYDDNVAFAEARSCQQFAPENKDGSYEFSVKSIPTVFSLKAETHNFPTTVEPFNGAATGAGGEIRDRMAGGKGSLPLGGTACYMTSYPRLQNGDWEKPETARPWIYQSPQEILIKASNGASDFGNKFGQPLINGSLLTFEYNGDKEVFGYDKTIMLAGGIGYANRRDTLKDVPEAGDKIILLGGDNYRIGMGGGAVSSVNTGSSESVIELNAVQRSNPEMQKRVFNCIRVLLERSENAVVLIHDHGAGGHINCLSELVEGRGGVIEMKNLPVGDPSLSDKEIIGNESQERMGLVVKDQDVAMLKSIAERERAPMYVIGTVNNEGRFVFENKAGETPVNITLDFLFGKPPKTTIEAVTVDYEFADSPCQASEFATDIYQVLSLEAVACKDWLTNKVDRSVTGKVVQQQCVGPFQLPLHGAGVMAVDFQGEASIATAMGHSPAAGLINAANGAVLSLAESLTNLIFVPLEKGIKSITLSANWMWPFKGRGEAARLYNAVQAVSQYAVDLGINISTGKDSLSMIQNYKDKEVRSPGTVIVSAAGLCGDIAGIVTPELKAVKNSTLLYVNMSGTRDNALGGSSWAQTKSIVGKRTPSVASATLFSSVFDQIQQWLIAERIFAGQDISAGGLITAAMEMAFTGDVGLSVSFPSELSSDDMAAFLFCEKPGLLIQVREDEAQAMVAEIESIGAEAFVVARCLPEEKSFKLEASGISFEDTLKNLRRIWFRPSYLLEQFQTSPSEAKSRFETFDQVPLNFVFPPAFTGKANDYGVVTGERPNSGIKAAIIREKGTNGEREMAYSLYAAGFDVKDVTMTDLTSGRETLEDVNFAVFCGGFSNSDVLGSARGWAGVFRYHQRARDAFKRFCERPDTLSLGICNGCQLMTLLGMPYPEHEEKVKMEHNRSGKFESAFLSVTIPEKTGAVLFNGLGGSCLGIWVAHGEGRFSLPLPEDNYDIALKYSRSEYPANPNGSDYNAAGIVSKDGRHLAMMPHLERAIFPWQWGYYPRDLKKQHDMTPWLQAFVNAKNWVTESVAN